MGSTTSGRPASREYGTGPQRNRRGGRGPGLSRVAGGPTVRCLSTAIRAPAGKRQTDEPATADPERETNTQLKNQPRTGTTSQRHRPTTTSTTACESGTLIRRPPAPPTGDKPQNRNQTTFPLSATTPPPLEQTRRQPIPRKASKRNDRDRPPTQSTSHRRGTGTERDCPTNNGTADPTRQTPPGRTIKPPAPPTGETAEPKPSELPADSYHPASIPWAKRPASRLLIR